MPNGKPRDHPLTDILVHGLRVFSRRADRLIKEIVALGGQAAIERAFDLFAPPPKREFEQRLTVMRDRLKTERRGTEHA